MLFVADSIQLVQLLPQERDIKIQGQVIHTVIYADDVLLMAKEEMVLQDTTDRLTEIGRSYGMECGKNQGNENLKATIPKTHDRSKQLENVKYLNNLGIMVQHDATYAHEIKFRTAMSKAAFNNKKPLLTNKNDLNLRKKLVKCCIWSIALYGAETWKLWKVDQKYLESFEMWCWRSVGLTV